MKKRWTLLSYNSSTAQHLREVLKINPIFCQMLAQRGISTYDEAYQFFRPSLEHLHDPFLMRDMDLAINRLTSAIQQKEKILLYGDYDVDGTTSVALMFSFLKKYHEQLDFYIPDRYTEGYGVSFAGVDYAAQNEITLIIAMDCGIFATTIYPKLSCP
jgi:single-stranded-DNA-specific exonuclease